MGKDRLKGFGAGLGYGKRELGRDISRHTGQDDAGIQQADRVRPGEIRMRQTDTRGIHPGHLLTLAESIAALGLIEPIVVDRNCVLLAGLHRFKAIQFLLTPPSNRVRAWSLQWLANQGKDADVDEVPEDVLRDATERIQALPDDLEHLRMIPVRVVPGVDARSDPDAALAVEVAENSQRRDYTRAEIRALADRLTAAGYTRRRGRPRKGEKQLLPALETIVGKSVRYLADELDRDDNQANFRINKLRTNLRVMSNANRRALKILEKDPDLADKLPYYRRLIAEVRGVIGGLSDRAKRELDDLGNDENPENVS